MKIEPCDVILTSRNGFLARTMDFFQKDPVKWGHSVIVNDKHQVYSYAFTGMRLVDVDKYLEKKGHYEIFRYKHLTPAKEAFMLKAMKKFEGKTYGWKRIYYFALNSIFQTKKYTEAYGDKMDQVCSTFVSWIYYVAFKTTFNGYTWKSVDPDDIDDHCSDHPEWDVIAEV